MTEHELKCWPAPFQAMWLGLKTAELRLNDRDYKVGDVLWLREYDPATMAYSGREIRRTVTHILAGPEWGLYAGYVMLSVR